MNSKLFVVAGTAVWFLTFLLGYFLLAPSTDDGYYVIAAMGTALTGSPGFWIGDEFSPSFFLPTVFTYFYGALLKLTMILGMEFGPLGFRFYHFVIIFLLPVSAWVALRRLFPRDYGIRLLFLLTFLLVTYFAQSAPTVRPEVTGAVLFLVFISLRKMQFARGMVPIFVLAVCGTIHPMFTLLAIGVFGVYVVRRFERVRFAGRFQWVATFVAFGLPFIVLAIYYAINFAEYKQQILGRTSSLSPNILMTPIFIWNNLTFWSDAGGIEFGLYRVYPAIAFIFVMILSTVFVYRRRSYLWKNEMLELIGPMLVAQWFVFFMLPPFVPYLAFSSFLAGLIIVLLWQEPHRLILNSQVKWVLIAACVSISLLFITFHSGKFLFFSEERLTPTGLYSVMSPLFEDPETELYTNVGRLVPPLIDHFSEGENIRINFLYLDPDCLPIHLKKRADRVAQSELPMSDPETTYWALNKVEVIENSDRIIRFTAKGSRAVISLVPSTKVYEDNKNLITKASSVTVELSRNSKICVDPVPGESSK